jgi:Fe-Mn family superoxide dismutase
MAYALPDLAYAYDALKPAIDEATMRLHHDNHHRAYVDATNKALEPYPEWQEMTIEELLQRLDETPDAIRATLRNQGGGHANHQFFWKIMTPNAPGVPSGDLAAAIDKEWGSFAAFQSAFEEAGTKHFGSGWAFLTVKPKEDFKLEIVTLPNQDSVLEIGAPGLIACDLWEHAYYLTYNNRRADWLKAFWSVVHWNYIGERYQGVREGRKQL